MVSKEKDITSDKKDDESSSPVESEISSCSEITATETTVTTTDPLSINTDEHAATEDGEISPGAQTEKLKREMQQLVFYNPGPSTKDLLGFRPEFSNREKRKLNRLIDDKKTTEEKKEKGKSKKNNVHDETGKLIDTGQDLCDCLIEDCQGCHFPCLKCSSEKCGSTCRCNRKWTYDYVYVDTK